MENTAEPNRGISFSISYKKLLYVFGVLMTGLAVGLLLTIYSFSSQKNTEKPSQSSSLPITEEPVTISGIFDINGIIPDGSYLEIGQKRVGDKDFNIVDGKIFPKDGGVWSWKGALEGKIYELQANLYLNGQVISLPKSEVVAAPASREILVVNSTFTSPTPVSVSPTDALRVGGTGTGVISGYVNLNGFVPQGASISVGERKIGDPRFSIVSEGVPAADHAAWGWNGALAGNSYELQANLNYQGTVIAVSDIVTVSAPAVNEILNLNSKFLPPSPVTGSISGKINLNGYIPQNSYLVVTERESGSNSQFNIVINPLSTTDGITWNWNNAKAGKSYDLQANLMFNNSVYSGSQILTVSAPAADEVLTINAQTLPPAPPLNSFGYNCLGKNSPNGQWQINIGYNNNSPNKDAKQYLIQLGNSSGDSSLVNTTTSPSNPSQSQSMTTNFILNENQTYFLRYAYSTCVNCNIFSPFTPDVQVNCYTTPPSPTPTFTPIPTQTPYPTYTPYPTLMPTEIPTDTPTQPPVPTN